MPVLSRWLVVPVCLALLMAASVMAQDVTPSPESDSATAPPPAPTAAPAQKPTPRQTLTAGDAVVELYFDSIKQGGFGILYVGGASVTGATASWLGKVVTLFPARGDGFYGFLTANIEQRARENQLDVFIETESGRETVSATVPVTLGGFVRSSFIVPGERVHLIDPEIERAEFARLSAVFAKPDQVRAWDDSGFSQPIFGELTSPFGELRILNETVETRHTGWDMRAATGVPVQASAAGRVAFAGVMDIRGNYVIIDHGYGVFSGYAHMSQIHVTRGQEVAAGQVVGLSGNTGRSSGPHMHWEMNINGDWINAADFARSWVP